MDYRSGSKTANETLDVLRRMNVELDDLSGYTQSAAKLLLEIAGENGEGSRRTDVSRRGESLFFGDME
jgi:hypothetical protein